MSEFPDTERLLERTNQKRTAQHLRRLQKSDRLPPVIFDAVFETIPGTAIEVVPIHKNVDGSLQVFLTQRSPKDKYWPSQWHCPGTMYLKSDVVESGDFSKPWERLKKKEFMRDSLDEPVKVGDMGLATKRGGEMALIHYVEVSADLKGGKYFNINELPENLVGHHKVIIEKAVEKYNNPDEK